MPATSFRSTPWPSWRQSSGRCRGGADDDCCTGESRSPFLALSRPPQITHHRSDSPEPFGLGAPTDLQAVDPGSNGRDQQAAA